MLIRETYDLPSIFPCSKCVQDVFRKSPRYNPDMFQISPSYVPDMSQMYPSYISQTCPRYVPDISHICFRYVPDRPKGGGLGWVGGGRAKKHWRSTPKFRSFSKSAVKQQTGNKKNSNFVGFYLILRITYVHYTNNPTVKQQYIVTSNFVRPYTSMPSCQKVASI